MTSAGFAGDTKKRVIYCLYTALSNVVDSVKSALVKGKGVEQFLMINKKEGNKMGIRRKGARIFLMIALVSAMVISTMGLALAGISSGVKKNTVVIGAITDLTGPAAWWGKGTTKGARILFDYINDEGGIHGRKLKFYVQDNHYDPVKTIAAAKYLISRYDVFCLFNICGSTPTVALFPLIDSEKIPVLPMINQSRQMFDPPKRYVFHAISGVSSQAIVAVDYIMKDMKAKSPRLAVINQDDEYGKDAMKGWVRAAKHYGLKVVAQERYKRGSLDMSSQVLSLKRANPDYVFQAGVGISSILKEAVKLDFKPQFIGESGNLMKTIEVAQDAARGFLVANDRATPEEDVSGIVKLKKLAEKYASGTKVNHGTIWGYLNAMVVVEGLKRTGKDLDREKFVDALETFKDLDTGGMSGPISYGPISQGPKSRRGIMGVKILKADIEKGYFVTITGWRKPSID